MGLKENTEVFEV